MATRGTASGREIKIQIVDDYDYGCIAWAKGHHDAVDFLKGATEAFCNECGIESFDLGCLGWVRQGHARITPASFYRIDALDSFIAWCDKGRGAFPVTYVELD